jgi:hypothetical protein
LSRGGKVGGDAVNLGIEAIDFGLKAVDLGLKAVDLGLKAVDLMSSIRLKSSSVISSPRLYMDGHNTAPSAYL